MTRRQLVVMFGIYSFALLVVGAMLAPLIMRRAL